MRKYLIFGLLAVALVVSTGIALAAKPTFRAARVTNPVTGEAKNTVVIPARAIEVAPSLYNLGEAVDPESGKVVKGYAIIDFGERFAKPGTVCGNGICEPSENAKKCPADCGGGEEPDSSCYGFLARGAKWKNLEPYLVDPENSRGLSETFVRSNLAADILKWESVAEVNILGDEISGIVDGADLVSPDNKNEVYFADIEESGAIGITVVWGIFRGPPSARELVEWDQVYDDVDFDWSANCESENCTLKMDFENIATHELGHSVGLDDLYNSKCSEQTMYGYADFGEIKKRTLEAGDIRGISELY